MDALEDEMKTVSPSLKLYEGAEGDLSVGHQKIGYHVIWGVKLEENFISKPSFLDGGHTTTTPTSLTYSSIISIYLVSISLTIAMMRNLYVLACDIKGVYLTANCHEKYIS